jgi:GATA zinc finger
MRMAPLSEEGAMPAVPLAPLPAPPHLPPDQTMPDAKVQVQQHAPEANGTVGSEAAGGNVTTEAAGAAMQRDHERASATEAASAAEPQTLASTDCGPSPAPAPDAALAVPLPPVLEPPMSSALDAALDVALASEQIQGSAQLNDVAAVLAGGAEPDHAGTSPSDARADDTEATRAEADCSRRRRPRDASRAGRVASGGPCTECGTKQSTLFRRTSEGAALCNACGLRYARRKTKQSSASGERSGSRSGGARPSGSQQGGRARRRLPHPEDRWCRQCGAMDSPQWRYVRDELACNACALRRQRQETKQARHWTVSACSCTGLLQCRARVQVSVLACAFGRGHKVCGRAAGRW